MENMRVTLQQACNYLRTISVHVRGVACIKFTVRNCEDVVNAFMQKIKKGAFTNSVDPDKMQHKVASHQGLHYLPC